MTKWLRIGQVLRYAKTKDPSNEVEGGFPNFWHVTGTPGANRALLEKGINPIGELDVQSVVRRPAVLIRSSPWKAGSDQTPWHDVFDLEHGHVRYFGDHKHGLAKPTGATEGNAALLRAFERHRAPSREQRVLAEPLLVFRSVTRGKSPKGHVEFCGVGLIERAERIVQWGGANRETFVNYVYDFAMLDLSEEGDQLDWAWIEARRNVEFTAEQALKAAPRSWRAWVEGGHATLPKVRRRVAQTRVVKVKDQKPTPGTAESKDLDTIYHHFDGRKHDFEAVASTVAARILSFGASYRHGWLTRRSGDGGADFVGRLDVGRGLAGTSLVVLGQAKCVKPESTISAEQIARVVARLRRGWIGVFVTTGSFSDAAQLEMVEDQYPIALVNGRELARDLRMMANEHYHGDLIACLDDIHQKHGTGTVITERRPEEILLE
uniref:SgeI n=1 Tax=Streptomyces griseoflavus TaxID=35619 RepID=G4V423_9ACTN|nr:SgeI [Streptomyces griseoflavus]